MSVGDLRRAQCVRTGRTRAVHRSRLEQRPVERTVKKKNITAKKEPFFCLIFFIKSNFMKKKCKPPKGKKRGGVYGMCSCWCDES